MFSCVFYKEIYLFWNIDFIYIYDNENLYGCRI